MADVLIVTGGSRGIGAATARMAAKRGYAVAVNYNTSAERADAVVADIKAGGGRAIAARADVATAAGVRQLFETVDRELGTVTALFNNAGTIHAYTAIGEFDAAMLDDMWRVNITSQFLCAGEAVKRMSTAKGGKGGAIVNMSSAAARLGGGNGQLAYAASKGAIDTFTHGLALEVAAQGIRVNAVRPGLIQTEIHDGTGDLNRLNNLVGSVPMGRTAPPEEVADAVLYLLSQQASYVTGSIVDVSGGR
ncbi:MAG: SDR family oxidoreductase [Hyphomicrobiaceae bacterium]|nr:SDR family oxidoreductase [Hyphomicrobiaceae bacterium]